jgi:uncharacterized protein
MSQVVWFELPAHDTERAKKFYTELFGWQFKPFAGSASYLVSDEAGAAIYPAKGADRGPLVYFAATDLDKELARIRQLGGKPGEKQETPTVGFYAHCRDTEGNPFSLIQRAGGGGDPSSWPG